MVINEGVEIYCKSVTNQVFTVVGLFVEIGTAIAKLKGSIKSSPYIKKPSVTATSNSPVKYSSLLSSLFFSSTLQYHS